MALQGLVFAVTGALSMKRAEFEQLLRQHGADVTPGVATRTTHLVTDDVDSTSGKAQKARAEGVEIVSETWVMERVFNSDDTAAQPSTKRALNVDADADADADEGAAPPPRKKASKLAPLTELANGEIHVVESASSSAQYRCKRVMDHYTCTCPAWRNQRNAPSNRTCKHLQQLLGADFEEARVQMPPALAILAPRTANGASAGGKPAGAAGATATAAAAAAKRKSVSLLLANKFDPSKHDPTGWHVSEKLDGLRAFWDGEQLFSRLGNPFPAPTSFTQHLPRDMTLDGELFMGRGMFHETISVVKTAGADAWPAELQFHVFDAPSLADAPFEARMQTIATRIAAHAASSSTSSSTSSSSSSGSSSGSSRSSVIHVVQHTVCAGAAQLEQELDRVVALGGEGVMLRQPASLYVGKRSASLLKHKRFHDAEAEVVSHEPGKGRHVGVMGALTLRMASGNTFQCGSGFTDVQRKAPPRVGAIVTYRFQEITPAGVPRFPTFVCECVDKDRPSDISAAAMRAGKAPGSPGSHASGASVSSRASGKRSRSRSNSKASSADAPASPASAVLDLTEDD